jgi:hypothetical protein
VVDELRIDLGDHVQGASAVTLPSGRVVVSAVVDQQPVLIRVRDGGGLDSSFNASGAVPGVRIRTDDDAKFNLSDQELSLFVRADGRIVTTGAWGLSRYTSDGLPDTSFTNPLGPIAPDGTVGGASRSAVQMIDGRILSLRSIGPNTIETRVLLPDGPNDTSYATNGVRSWPVDAEFITGSSPLVQRGSGWSTALWGYSGDRVRVAIASFDAEVVLRASTAGFRHYPAFTDFAFPVLAVDGFGRTVVAAAETGSTRCVVARLLPNGDQDRTFGTAESGHVVEVPGSCTRPLVVAAASDGTVFVASETSAGVMVFELEASGVVGQRLVPDSVDAAVRQLWLDGSDPVVMWSRGGELTISRVDSPLPAARTLSSVVPARLLESRSGPGNVTVDGQSQGIGRRPAESVYELPVTGRVGVPADATAVMLNVTAIAPDAPGYLTVFPCGAARPQASNVNYMAGDVIPNAVLARIGTGGKVCIYTSARTDLIVDINGYIPIG